MSAFLQRGCFACREEWYILIHFTQWHMYIYIVYIYSSVPHLVTTYFLDRDFNRFPPSLQLLWETVLPDINSKELDIIVIG